jgi:hypothetical protein
VSKEAVTMTEEDYRGEPDHGVEPLEDIDEDAGVEPLDTEGEDDTPEELEEEWEDEEASGGGE